MKAHITLLLCVVIALPDLARAEDTDLPIAAPETTARQEALIASFERLAGRVQENCESFEGERGGAEFNDQRCYEWYSRIVSEGAIAAHAVGRVTVSEARAHLTNASNHANRGALELISSTWQQRHELGGAEGRIHHQGPVLVPYLLQAASLELRVTAPRIGHFDALLSAIAALTGNNVSPVAPWMRRDFAARRDAYTQQIGAWVEWMNAHASESLRTWRANGERDAIAALSSPDTALRFAAIMQLAYVDHARARVQTSARELLGMSELSAEARTWISRELQQRDVLTRAQARRAIGT